MIPKASKSIKPGMMYTGEVVVNEHPQGRRFVKIRFPTVDSPDIPDDKLPWSGIGRPLFRGGGGKVGFGSVPRVGTRVSGFFNDGERNSFVAIVEVDDPKTDTGLGLDEWGMQDEEGTYFIVKVGKQTEIQHQGATITIGETGGISMKSPENINIEAEGDVIVNGKNIYLND